MHGPSAPAALGSASAVQLYLTAICLGLACHLGKSTYASAITHALIFAMALFGSG